VGDVELCSSRRVGRLAKLGCTRQGFYQAQLETRSFPQGKTPLLALGEV